MKGKPKGRSRAPEGERSPGDDQFWPILAVGCLILVLCGGIYGQVRQHEFVDYDDIGYFLDDPRLDGRLTGDDLVSAFAEPYFANWSPVSSISIRVGDALHGKDAGAHLLTNAALHAFASVFLFLALLKLSGQFAPSAFVGLVFAVHPLHVESVAWASERKDVLAAFFWMASLLAYGFYVADRTRIRHGILLLLGFLAMLSKPTAVALPITLVLLDFWPRKALVDWGSLSRRIAEKWPLIVGAALVAGATYFVQDDAGARQTGWISFSDRILNAGLSYVTYIADTFWPADLAVFYPYPDAARLASWQPVAALVLLLGLSFAALRAAPGRPYLLMGWLWFLLTLLPMIGLVQVGTQGHADRYMYVPMIGVLIPVAWGVSEALSRWPRIQWVGLALGAGVVAGLAATAHTQVGHWRNTVDLFSHTLESTGPNALAQRTLGVAYWVEGDHGRGEEHLRMAVQLDPSWADARLALALSLNQVGRFEEARLHFERARDDGADPGRVHGGLGVAAQQLGDDAEAARQYRAALEARPEEWEVVNNLAWLRATSRDRQIRDAEAAVDLASKAVAALPENAEFLGTLARAYAESGRYFEAVATQQRAIDAVAPDAAPGTRARFEAELRGYREQRTGPARP